MKNLTIAGRLTKDAETRQAGSDKVTGFSVAVDDRSGKDKSALFFDCSLWGKRGEALAQYLTKGTSVVVTGDLGTREHNGKTYLTVKADNVTLMGGGKDKSAEGFRGGGSGDVAGGDRGRSRGETYDVNDDIPF